MADEKAKPWPCVNCREPAVRIGNVIECDKCGTFEIRAKEGPRVKQTPRIDALEQRVDALEGAGGPPADQDQDQDQDQTDPADQADQDGDDEDAF